MVEADMRVGQPAAATADGRGGPAVPTPDARVVLRPLGLDAIRLDPDGLLGRWQQRNVAATLPHCIEQLDRAGALGNLEALRTGADREHVGMWFSDTDVYKTLEAAAWELARPQPTGELAGFLEGTAALLGQVQE